MNTPTSTVVATITPMKSKIYVSHVDNTAYSHPYII